MADDVKEGLNLSVMPTYLPFELCQLGRQLPMARHQFPQLHECSHNGDVHLDRALASLHTGQHRDTLFREYVGRVSATTSPPGF